MEENRQRMAALKESLMSGQANGKAAATGPSQNAGAIDFDFKLPEFKMPEVNIKVPEVNMSAVKPDLPKVELPKVDIPRVDIPKVDIDLPKVDIDVSGITSNVTNMTSGVTSNVTSTLQSVRGSTRALVDSEISALVDGIRAAGDSVLSQVPPEVREQAMRAGDLLDGSIDAYNSNPEGYSIVLGIALGLPLLLAYSAAYGGYNGVVKPVKAIEMLQNGDALLVDVRKVEERKQDGVPLLKLAARGKGVAVPLPMLSGSVSRQVSNPKGLAIEILGQQIGSISKLNPQTKVIVMDRKGEVAKEVARACRAAGVRSAYVMDGGFYNYRREEGMAVDGKDFYEDGPLALAGDQVESLTSGLKEALSDRKGAAMVLGTLATAVFVGANLHEVLKYVGVLGIEATVVVRYVLGDESIGDDLLAALSAFDAAVGTVTSLANKAKGMTGAQGSGAEGN